jgi:hypothetical protein
MNHYKIYLLGKWWYVSLKGAFAPQKDNAPVEFIPDGL